MIIALLEAGNSASTQLVSGGLWMLFKKLVIELGCSLHYSLCPLPQLSKGTFKAKLSSEATALHCISPDHLTVHTGGEN